MISAIIDYLKVSYYRYTIQTGVYMLGSVETITLHIAVALGIYFLFQYSSTFIYQLSHDGYINIKQ